MSRRVGVEIGGTFTGLVALADDGWLILHKFHRRRARRRMACSTRCGPARRDRRERDRACPHASTAYVLQTGRVVLSGAAKDLIGDSLVLEASLGIGAA